MRRSQELPSACAGEGIGKRTFRSQPFPTKGEGWDGGAFLKGRK
jgi:hypothetical protein